MFVIHLNLKAEFLSLALIPLISRACLQEARRRLLDIEPLSPKSAALRRPVTCHEPTLRLCIDSRYGMLYVAAYAYASRHHHQHKRAA